MAKALLSVADKTGIVELARALLDHGYELVSTGQTARELRQAGFEVQSVADLIGFPEILGGRVKTLHPVVFAGLLARRELAEHTKELEEHHIEAIDVVAVNLYPFQETVRSSGVTLDDALENIDIGGVSLLRAAAKNYQSVVVLSDPGQYEMVIGALKEKGEVDLAVRRQLAQAAFSSTAVYDSCISQYLKDGAYTMEQEMTLAYEKVQDLRYGENPHQKAAFYRDILTRQGLGNMRQLAGSELSFNNLADADAALNLVVEFTQPAAVAIKHNNPCGVGIGANLAEAFQRAYQSDSVSIYGGIVAFNGEVDAAVSRLLSPIFLEVLLAPSYTEEALRLLMKKKKLRILQLPQLETRADDYEVRRLQGGILWQERDTEREDTSRWETVTQRKPTSEERSALELAWRVVKHVKSNAIVVANNYGTLGVGAGQMNRVTSTRLALEQAGDKAKGAVMASDAMFPFADSLLRASEAGIAAVVQPGGSIRDDEVIHQADEADMAMMFTGRRHFRH